ncbi:ead/Ea22-like family protein [Enterobacter ludwigii]|uniref:ead/Ea22-like family protein n=1 Tax=Enterobacter ludwigii TaxID=299767 RepID=UPI0039758E2D
MSNIDKRALRKAAIHAKTVDDWGCDADNFHEKATPNAVLALLDELEAKDRRNAELEDLLFSEISLWTQRYDTANSRREAAEKRIAELEAREVKLPKPISVLHRRDFADAHRSIYAYPEAEVNAALSDAGIRIHGED